MRNLTSLAAICGLSILGACDGGAGAYHEPPVLKIMSPARSLVQDHAGSITVTGIATPNDTTAAEVTKVTVNDVPAVVGPDGSFTAVISATTGFTSIHTVAHAADGGEATDTRAVMAGELRKPGANIDRALTAAISANAFGKISTAAGTMVKGMDVGGMVRAMNPVQHAGDPNGEDCLFDRVYLDDLTFGDITFSLVPTTGAIDFSVEIDNLDAPGHARFALACISGTESWRVTAQKVVVSGQLDVQPNGMAGFDTKLVNPYVNITGLNIDASGIPGDIIDMMDLNSTIEWVVEQGAELAMGPVMNKALGGLAGPKQLSVLGKTIDMQVAPSAIVFDPNGGLVTLDTSMLVEGAEDSTGYIYTDNGMPTMNPGQGFELGLADDLANEMMSQMSALGMLNLSQPSPGAPFDTTAIAMTLPPMISADPTDGTMQVMLGDMTASFLQQGVPMAKAAINAKIALQIVPAGNGYQVAVQLGKPSIEVDILDDVANQTGYSKADLSRMVELTLASQIDTISKFLTAIPLPQVAGLTMRNFSIGSDVGYVMVKGELQ